MPRLTFPKAMVLALPVIVAAYIGVGRGAAHRTPNLVGELVREAGVPEAAGVRLSVPTAFRSCEGAPGTLPSAGACRVARHRLPKPAAAVIRRAEKAANASADPGALHALAVANLLFAGDAAKPLHESISYLESAARLSEDPAPVLADLAAAHLMLAAREQDARSLIEALEAAERALEVDSGNLAARFNKAQALEWIGLPNQAREAWASYRAADPASAWGQEARRRESAAQRSRPAAPRDRAAPAEMAGYAAAAPREARDLALDELLAGWGRAALAGDSSTAGRRLEQAAAIGDALVARGGDASVADAVHEIRRRQGDRRALMRLAAQHREFAEGRAPYLDNRYDRACPHFRRVVADGAPAPLGEWARTYVDICIHYERRSREASRLLADLAAGTDAERYPALAGRRWWALGGVLLSLGMYEEGLEPLRRAFPLLERAGEREYAGGALTQLGYGGLQLGDPAGYGSLHRALAMLREYPATKSHHNLLYALAIEAEADGLTRVALQVQDEAVAAARSDELPTQYRAEALLARARRRQAAGRTDVDADVRAAIEIMARLDSGFARGWLDADLQETRAGAWLDARPARAVAELDSVIDWFGRQDFAGRLIPALFSRAGARLALGRPDLAAADLRRATVVLDTLRAHVPTAQLRASLLEASRRVFDRAVMVSVNAGNPGQALEFVEQSRASFSPFGHAADWTRRPLRARPGEVAVELALIGDTLLAWTLRGDTLSMTRAMVRREALLRDVEQVRAALQRGAPEPAVRPALEALYDQLVRPVRARLGPAGTPLVIVADGELAAIPMAALRSRELGRYLLKDHAVRFASSLRDPVLGPARRASGEPVTLIADPAFDRRTFPDLEPLGGAAAEAAAVARLYPGARVVAGARADASALRAALLAGGIAHFAGHAVFDDARPERSYLVPASPTGGGPARLTAADVEKMDLHGLRLVVLSACQTARAQAGRSGGFAGLSGAFLAAGAGGIVGSLWRVDDHHTRVLMEAFHRSYRASGDPAAALREAQLEMLRSNDTALRSPAAWAGFRYAGG